MKRVVFSVVGTVAGLIMLLSFKTHSTAGPIGAPPPVVSTPTPGSAGNGGGAGPGGGAAAPPSQSQSPQSSGTKTVTGDAANTYYGPVQVQITVAGSKVTAATAPVYPTRTAYDQQLNAYAIPILNQEAVASGNASIQGVSGATYTSGGYVQSLQSALNKAGL